MVAAVASVLLAAMIGAPDRSEAALLERGDGANVVIGKDDDNNLNPDIQPAGTVANQSLNNADVLSSAAGNDVLIGLLGSDVMQGGRGRDIEVGGTEQVFCTSQAGGAIIFANLTQDKPEFDEVSLAEVRELNPDVRRIIR